MIISNIFISISTAHKQKLKELLSELTRLSKGFYNKTICEKSKPKITKENNLKASIIARASSVVMMRRTSSWPASSGTTYPWLRRPSTPLTLPDSVLASRSTNSLAFWTLIGACSTHACFKFNIVFCSNIF